MFHETTRRSAAAELLNRFVERLEQGLDVFELEAGERHPDVGRTRRNETDADTCTLVNVAQSFETSGFNVRQLMFDIATSDGFTKRPNI